MKAAVYDGVGRISVKEAEMPATAAGGIVIRVESCAICGTDL
ncbi:Zn-dependent alcohol dehydrogenase, partial [Candidatus Desantisbacteria bacterium CG_4_9_14_3_um_filter_50_7]